MQLPDLPRADAYLDFYAVQKPDTPAWIEGERVITFAQAQAWVQTLSSALITNGVQAGQRVAVFGKASPEFMALFLAITGIGGIYVGLNPKYTSYELGGVIEDCQPVLLFNLLDHDPEQTGKIQQLLSTRGSLRYVGGSALSLFAQTGHESPATLRLERQASIQPLDVAMLVYTSGSTGTPKGAQLTHKGITFIGRVANDPAHFGVPGQGRTLCNLPINHVGCVVDTCTNSLVGGATLVFQADFDPVAMLQAVEQFRLTLWGGVPVMFLAMAQLPNFTSTDFSSLQRVVLAGNSPSLPLVQMLQQLMPCPVLNGYGLTEAMGFSTFTAHDDSAEVIAHTVGRFDPRIEWRLEDDEIQLRGDWLFKGYFGRPQETAEAFTDDGWFRTGDLASLTPEGHIRLIGRRKEMFKSGGYNVYPLEVERALESIPGVVMAVVVPRPDVQYVEVGHAFVVAHPGVTSASLQLALRERLANFKVPKHIECLPEMPMLPIGKVDRLALKRRVQAMAASDGRGDQR